MNMKPFDVLLESYGMLNTQQRLFYPRNFNLSPEFINALKREINSHCGDRSKNGLPPKLFAQKLNKALLFYISDFEKMQNMKTARTVQPEIDTQKKS
jgi:hypothetical protein